MIEIVAKIAVNSETGMPIITEVLTPSDVETVAEGFEFPWGMALLPDGRFLVTERAGQIYLMRVAYVGELIVSTTPRHQAERPATRPEPVNTVLAGEVTDGDDEPMVA